MKIHGLEKLSLVDYDGFATATVFTGGCNFLCPFCHNAALVQRAAAQPVIPREDVLAYLTKRRGLLDGVCVTGGEPTLEPDLEAFIAQVKALGYRVKLDTNGTAPQIVRRLAENQLIDYVAVDIKNSPSKYGLTVGKPDLDLSPVRETVAFLIGGTLPYEFRTTVVEQFHTEADMRAIGEWIRGAEKYWIQKFIDSGDCVCGGLTAIAKERAEAFLKIVASYVKNAALRGY